jgi:hypothetical protein
VPGCAGDDVALEFVVNLRHAACLCSSDYI